MLIWFFECFISKLLILFFFQILISLLNFLSCYWFLNPCCFSFFHWFCWHFDVAKLCLQVFIWVHSLAYVISVNGDYFYFGIFIQILTYFNIRESSSWGVFWWSQIALFYSRYLCFYDAVCDVLLWSYSSFICKYYQQSILRAQSSMWPWDETTDAVAVILHHTNSVSNKLVPTNI